MTNKPTPSLARSGMPDNRCQQVKAIEELNAKVMAERAPSGEGIDGALQQAADALRNSLPICAGPKTSAAHNRAYVAVCEALARRATAGTTAAPIAEKVKCGECNGTGQAGGPLPCSDCNGKGYDWEPVERATAGTTAAPSNEPVKPWEDRESLYETDVFSKIERMEAEIADWRATSGNATPTELKRYGAYVDAGGFVFGPLEGGPFVMLADVQRFFPNPAATAAPVDLPPLPDPFMDLHSATVRDAWADQMREYGRACIASNAGAAPTDATTHEGRLKIIRDSGDRELIKAVQVGQISIKAAVEKCQRAAPSNPPVGAAQEKDK